MSSTEDLGAAIEVLARLSRVLDSTDTGLTVPQYRVMAMIRRGGERSSRLARRLAVAKPTMTALVDGLLAAGYVDRVADPTDGRAMTLRLTPAGRRALSSAEEALVERFAPIFGHVADPRRLLELFAELGDALNTGKQHRYKEMVTR